MENPDSFVLLDSPPDHPPRQQQQEQSLEQGFVTNSFLVRNTPNKPKPTNSDANKCLPLDYQPRYIYGQGILKKQPKEVYERIEEMWVRNDRQNHRVRRARQNKFKPIPLYDKYSNQEAYSLVYSRWPDPSNPGGMKAEPENITGSAFPVYSLLIPIENLINLTPVLQQQQYNPALFSILKPFRKHNPENISSENSTSQRSNSDTLSFDSRFESGNLAYAFLNRSCKDEYHLLMQDDVNSQGYNQWFYFSVQNAKKGRIYVFRIVNFRKKHSLFNEGMKPCVFSQAHHRATGNGWKRTGLNIAYDQSNTYKNQNDTSLYYTLTFHISFDYQNDYALISLNPPYSYSRLNTYLYRLENKLQSQITVEYQKKVLAYSLSCNPIPLITVTHIDKPGQNKKKVIGVMARQHPGEVWSSYLMEGFLHNLLLSNTEQSQLLLKNYIFKIIPMVNVDGVIYGNFRCDISGTDLNRQWRNTNPSLHPQVSALKELVSGDIETEGLEYQMFLDLHGHSKNYNTFCYTCWDQGNQCRILPLLISKFNHGFDFQSCTFGIDRSKESTGRAFLFQKIGKVNVLTIESSFLGKISGDKRVTCFQPKDMYQMAKSILYAIFVYSGGAAKEHQFSREQLESQIKQMASEFVKMDEQNQDNSGSDSDPEADELDVQKLSKLIPQNSEYLVFKKQQRQERLKAVKTTRLISQTSRRGSNSPQKINKINIVKKLDHSIQSKRQPRLKQTRTSPPAQHQTRLPPSLPFNRKAPSTNLTKQQPSANYPEQTNSRDEPKITFKTRNTIFSNEIQRKPVYRQFDFHNQIREGFQQRKALKKEPKHNKGETSGYSYLGNNNNNDAYYYGGGAIKQPGTQNTNRHHRMTGSFEIKNHSDMIGNHIVQRERLIDQLEVKRIQQALNTMERFYGMHQSRHLDRITNKSTHNHSTGQAYGTNYPIIYPVGDPRGNTIYKEEESDYVRHKQASTPGCYNQGTANTRTQLPQFKKLKGSQKQYGPREEQVINLDKYKKKDETDRMRLGKMAKEWKKVFAKYIKEG